uniref:Ciliary BBSome complex subunit 2 C-terminal domain-containing protein n=1 Tax=Meloidogyne incognita TaxID=6306 RepID=A0A914M037_MELIC
MLEAPRIPQKEFLWNFPWCLFLFSIIFGCILDLTGGLSSTFSIGRSSISSNMSEISGAIRERESLCLRLTLSNEVPIRAALLFAEGIFDSECYTVHPNGKESAELNVNFCPAKNVFAELFIKVFAGYSIERQLRVFEVNQVLPRFVTFVQIDQSIAQQKPPECFVSFRLQSRIDQLRLWICENFAFVDEEKLQNEPSLVAESEGNDGGKKLQLYFFCTRNQEMLYINWDLNSGEFQFRHNDIQNVTDLIQSMCANMNVRELRSRAHFPSILANVKNIVESMDERYQVNERLSSEMVERINFVRECVVRAEDMLVIRDFSDARKLYGRLTILNKELIGQKTVRMAARKEYFLLCAILHHLNLN